MDSLTESVAIELLRRDGASVIWQAHVTAARVYRDGESRAAEILLNIADAAEEAMRRDGAVGSLETTTVRVPGRLQASLRQNPL